MSYVESTLSRDEKVLYEGKISWMTLVPAGIALALLIIINLAVGKSIIGLTFLALIVLIKQAIYVITTELAVTNKRIAAKTGLIIRRTVEIALPKVESIKVDQGIFARLFNYGTIVVTGSGSSHKPIHGIEDPIKKH